MCTERTRFLFLAGRSFPLPLCIYKFVWFAQFSPLRTTPEQTDDAKLFHLTAVMVFLGVHIVSVVIIVLLRGMRIL